MCKAGSNAFDTDGDAMTFSGTELEFDHFPGAEHTGCQPKVVVLVPVLILGGPQLGTESCRTNFAILVKREAILQKLPSSVNDLRTGLALNWLLHTWNFVRDDADVGRVLPPPFPIDLHPLLGVDDIVTDDARDVHLVGLCSIGVQDGLLVLKVSFRKRSPLHLANGTWARRAFFGHPGHQALQDQRLGIAPFDKPTPLFPNNGQVLVRSQGLQVFAIKGSFIGFDITPCRAITKVDAFFLVLDPTLSKVTELLLHQLNGLVVDTEEAVDHRMGDLVQLEEKKRSLNPERCRTRTIAVCEERVEVVRIDVDLAAEPVATMFGHAANINLGLGQSAFSTPRA